MIRRLARAAAAAGLMLGLGACQEDPPQVAPPPVPAEPPAIVEAGQIERILDQLGQALEAGAKEQSAEPMAGRVGGAALAMAEAQFKGEKANPEADRPELGSQFSAESIVTRSDTWPRSFVVGAEYEQARAQYLYRIEQADPRSPYKLVAWAQMLPKVVVPPTAKAEVGSAVVGPGDEGLKLTPLAAVEAYAKAKGDAASAEAKLFDTFPESPDPVQDSARARWLALVKAVSDGAAEFSGSATQTSEVVEGSVFAVATADSGALVFGQLTSTVEATFAPPEGGSVNLMPGGYEGLAAAGLTATKSVRIEHSQTVVLAVPPADSGDLIRVIAVSDQPTAVAAE